MAANPRISARVNERRLYILAAILIPLIVLAGFAQPLRLIVAGTNAWVSFAAALVRLVQ